MFENYEAPIRGNKYLQEKNIDQNGVVIRLLQNPVFAWKDMAFTPKTASEPAIKLCEDYYPYSDPRKKPKITKFPEIKAYKSTKDREAKHIWATLVFNQKTEDIQYFELSNSEYMNAILQMHKDGYNLLDQDIKLTKTLKKGTESDFIYSAVPVPPSANMPLPATIEQDIIDMNIDLNRIFITGDPFKENEANTDDLDWSKTNRASEFANDPNQSADNLPDPKEVVNGTAPDKETLPKIDMEDIQTPF